MNKKGWETFLQSLIARVNSERVILEITQNASKQSLVKLKTKVT